LLVEQLEDRLAPAIVGPVDASVFPGANLTYSVAGGTSTLTGTGITFDATITKFDFSAVTSPVYWGPSLIQLDLQTNTGANLQSFPSTVDASSNLPGGVAIWVLNNFPVEVDNPSPHLEMDTVRFMLTVTDLSHVALPLIPSASGVTGSQGALLQVHGNFEQTRVFQVFNGTTWVAAGDYITGEGGSPHTDVNVNAQFWFDNDIVIQGTGGNDNFVVSVDNTTSPGTPYLQVTNNAVVVFDVPLSDVHSLTLDSTPSGTDTASIDYTNGNPYPPGGITFEGSPLAQTFTVNSTADTNTGDPTTNMGTLRWVIGQANSFHSGTAATPDHIVFSAGGAGTNSVGASTSAALPALTDIAIIDGTSAPGYAGTPLVTLDGTSAGAGANGLTISGGHSTVEGLDIVHFTGNGIQLDTAGSDLVAADRIGITTADARATNSKNGILINGISGNTIGGTSSGLRNIISGNTRNGIAINGAAATGNLIEGNYIGTNSAGTARKTNIADGIFMNSAHNTVGGTAAGAGNLISGNGFGSGGANLNGVDITGANASANLVQGNTIGADATGSTDVDNAFADVFIGNGAANNTVGGTTTAAGNLLTSAFQAGVYLFGNNTTGTSGNLIEGNTIGLLAGGTAKSINPFGVELTNGASNNTIGGAAAGAGNVICGSSLDGVEIDTAGTSGNVVQGNTVGTNAVGGTSTFLQNGWAGIFVGYGSTNNTIGGGSAGAGNLLSNNFETGLELFESDSTGNVVQGNKIGTDSTGASAVANGVNGIFLLDTSNNTIGGTTGAAGNLISGNKVDGIDLISFNNTLPCSGNLIEGNSIGTQAGGNAALANGWAGIFIGYGSAANNTIGGLTAGASNLISGNAAIGIELFQSGATGNLIQANLIGTNASATAKLGNFYGIEIAGGASNNTIGGAVAGSSNIISGNGGDGILIQNSGAATGNLIQWNIIGSNSITAGTGANLGNGGNGVELQSGTGPNTVGGVGALAPNRIVFNTGQAILDNGTGDNTSNNILS
jgi:hypothetical protein